MAPSFLHHYLSLKVKELAEIDISTIFMIDLLSKLIKFEGLCDIYTVKRHGLFFTMSHEVKIYKYVMTSYAEVMSGALNV